MHRHKGTAGLAYVEEFLCRARVTRLGPTCQATTLIEPADLAVASGFM